jgi:ribosomal protein S18 acetylase RimI-like enzyme
VTTRGPGSARLELASLPRGAIPAAGRLCARAFRDYQLHEALVPGPPEDRTAYVRRLYAAILADCVRSGIVHAAVSRGRLAGVAAWLPPGRYPQGPLRQLRMGHVALTIVRHHRDRIPEALDALWRVERHHPDEPPHWYLNTVAVDPDHQQRGVGGALVRPVLDLADRIGEPAFLETASARNAAWYERLGFETLTARPAFDGGPTQWAMWREPREG